jgi:hypothetical protein
VALVFFINLDYGSQFVSGCPHLVRHGSESTWDQSESQVYDDQANHQGIKAAKKVKTVKICSLLVEKDRLKHVR